MELKTIAQKLRGIRKACGFTQQQIAAVLSVDRSTYTYYETGKTTPDIHTVKALADLFNVSVDELLADEEPASPLLSDTGEEEVTETPDADNTKLLETANRLTRTERELLLCFRALPMKERMDILQAMHETVDAENLKKKCE